MKKNFKGYLVLLIFILFVLPIAIGSIITFGSWLSFIDGNSNIWIGFWGSYLGGILGTIGVIYVAYLQNKMQQDNLEKQFDAQLENLHRTEKLNRERMSIQTKIKMFEDYADNLNFLHSKMMSLRFTLIKIFGNYDLYNTYSRHKNVFSEERINNLENQILTLIKEMNIGINLPLETENILYITNTFIDLGYELEGDFNLNIVFEIERLIDFFEHRIPEYQELLIFISGLNNKEETYQSLNSVNVNVVEDYIDWLRNERANARIEILTLLKKLEEDI